MLSIHHDRGQVGDIAQPKMCETLGCIPSITTHDEKIHHGQFKEHNISKTKTPLEKDTA